MAWNDGVDGATEHPSLALPPAELPPVTTPQITPVRLRRMELADSPAAFVLSEIAFDPPGAATAEEHAARQERWSRQGRAWHSWLHARAGDNAWVATSGADDCVVGYARALRDPARRLEQLTELYVHPAFQRGKVGKALLSAVLAEQVPQGWRRVIVAHPSPAALALYYRWGTLPLGAAWYVVTRPHPQLRSSFAGEGRSLDEKVALDKQIIQQGVRHDSLPLASSNAPYDHPFSIRREGVGGWGQLPFVATHLGATISQRQRDGETVAWGARCGGEIGPLWGATPADALALTHAQMAEAWQTGAAQLGLWVPAANTTLLRWLRETSGPRLRLCSQVMIMGSDPALAEHLDRSLLTAPPYVW